MKKLSRSEMKKVLGGYVTETRCFMGGAAACAGPNGAYGGWTNCEGDHSHCYTTGTAACATDACCTSWCCDT